MPAYLVSHRDRALSGEASTRSLIAERVSRLWPDARQMDASNWIVTSTGPADEVRDQLTDLLREGDALIVIGAGSEAAWAGWNPPTSIGRCLRHAAGRPPLISGPPHACRRLRGAGALAASRRGPLPKAHDHKSLADPNKTAPAGRGYSSRITKAARRPHRLCILTGRVKMDPLSAIGVWALSLLGIAALVAAARRAGSVRYEPRDDD